MNLYKVASALVFPLLMIACGQPAPSSPVPDQATSSNQTASPKLSAQVNRDDRDCVGQENNRTDFFRLFQGKGNFIKPTMCFANGGDLNVFITDVWAISPGNNAGYIETNIGRVYFQRSRYSASISSSSTVTITKIHIY
jgi:hypothetical protein